jgi:hypothetical protein
MLSVAVSHTSDGFAEAEVGGTGGGVTVTVTSEQVALAHPVAVFLVRA